MTRSPDALREMATRSDCLAIVHSVAALAACGGQVDVAPVAEVDWWVWRRAAGGCQLAVGGWLQGRRMQGSLHAAHCRQIRQLLCAGPAGLVDETIQAYAPRCWLLRSARPACRHAEGEPCVRRRQANTPSCMLQWLSLNPYPPPPRCEVVALLKECVASEDLPMRADDMCIDLEKVGARLTWS